jgi:hypothetical protein
MLVLVFFRFLSSYFYIVFLQMMLHGQIIEVFINLETIFYLEYIFSNFSCSYQGIVRGKLDQLRRCFEVLAHYHFFGHSKTKLCFYSSFIFSFVDSPVRHSLDF